MNTRKYPRTMREVWGPYTSNDLQPMPDNRPMDWQDRVVLAASVATVVVCLLLGVLWVCAEHNALHFGENHNTVAVANKALAALRELQAEQKTPEELGYVPLSDDGRSVFIDGIGEVALQPAQQAQKPVEVVAWESTTPALKKYVTQARYDKFKPNIQRWYKPFKCSNCAEQAQHPPRQWVELTKEEVIAVIQRIDPDQTYLPSALKQLSSAISAALRKANGGAA